MATRILPTPEQLRELLRYEPETGKLFWLPRARKMFRSDRSFGAWHSNYCGKEAFTATHAHGYKFGTILERPYLAHRVAWAISFGVWPEHHIDHANGDQSDNRLNNLRSASRSENMGNSKRKSSNSCGLKGVTFHKETGRWRARLTKDLRQISLGIFDTPEAAHAAYCEAAKKYHGEYARTQ